MKKFTTSLILSACIAAYAEANQLSQPEHIKEAMRKAIAAKLKAGKLSQVDSESHMNIEHFRTSQDFSQVDSNIEYSEDGQIAIMEERSPRRYTMAQTKEIQCKESMGWRNVAQTDVKSFVEQSPTKVYSDTVFTKAIATENAAAQWGSLDWFRAQDKMTPAAGYSLWGEGGFKYDSLNQGSLGDCWFLASIISLGNADPNLVKNLFLSPELNNSRIYGVNLFDLGVQTTVVIDDYVPFNNGTPSFEQASDNKGLWPILLEKAFSKFHGNYKTIEGGITQRSIEVMTGFPGFSRGFGKKTVDELWAMLEKEVNEKSIMSASTLDKTYTNGLAGGHAYALLGIYKLSNGIRLVKLANPWGVDSFKGDWSDNSSKWTPALRKEVASVVNEQDGVFFQTIDQLKADWWGFSFNKNMTTWKKSQWLNLGRDIKSATYFNTFCKTENCRGNKFNLTSAVTQTIYLGIGTHDYRDYVGCTLDPKVRQYFKVSGTSYFESFDTGTQWRGPFTIQAGQPFPLLLELELLTQPLKNEWSVIVFGEQSEVQITHSDGYGSDAWPLQRNFTQSASATSSLSNYTIVDTLPNEIDGYVQFQALESNYNDCVNYKSGKSSSFKNNIWKNRVWYGHGCTSKTLRLQVKFWTDQRKQMTMLTTQHKVETCSMSGNATVCTYLIKGGPENQLGFIFPLKDVTTSVVSATFI